MADKFEREGNLLYTTEHAGWAHGKEVRSNRVCVRLEFAGSVSEHEREAIIRAIQALPSDRASFADRAMILVNQSLKAVAMDQESVYGDGYVAEFKEEARALLAEWKEATK